MPYLPCLLGAVTVVVLGAQGAGLCSEPPGVPATAVFERLKALAGTWQGRSTRGWTDRVTIQVIAAGSAVLFDSFDAHPNERMLTLVHPDGERLLLTHYCVAGNQPRLVLSQVEEDGRLLRFRFLDGGNLPSRDRGHMDSLALRLVDADRFTERWTWYQDGNERWMEEIEMRRAAAP
jgi:hypothetical protein